MWEARRHGNVELYQGVPKFNERCKNCHQQHTAPNQKKRPNGTPELNDNVYTTMIVDCRKTVFGEIPELKFYVAIGQIKKSKIAKMDRDIFDDPSKIDMSMLASLPVEIRMELQHELAASSKRPKQQDNTKKPNNKVATRNCRDEEENTTKKKRKNKYWQAKETKDGEVEVLCFECRREPRRHRQQTLQFSSKRSKPVETTVDDSNNDNNFFCARCRVPLQHSKQKSQSTTTMTANKVLTVLPQVTRLKGYKRLASDTKVPFAMTDSEAMEIMRQSCFGCGKSSGDNGNGISRLRSWEGFSDATREAAKKRFMGPFSKQNCIAACSVCNLMKGARSVASFVEACRTIATHRNTTGKDYGRYAHRFRDNISKRSRSCYITKSSTHTKTHCLTNQQFNDIVNLPCAYCGKQPSDNHHNGLDRLDSDNRVYSTDNVVSCCGDCNIMKYKHSVDFFIHHCCCVADHHLGVVFNDDKPSLNEDHRSADHNSKLSSVIDTENEMNDPNDTNLGTRT